MHDPYPDFPNSPLTNVVYCPDPLLMTDEEIEREIPRSRWLAEMSELASLTSPSKHTLPSTYTQNSTAPSMPMRNGRANAS